MTNQKIDETVRECGGVLPVKLYAEICNSEQIDHIKRDGDWIDLWADTGEHWRVKVKGE